MSDVSIHALKAELELVRERERASADGVRRGREESERIKRKNALLCREVARVTQEWGEALKVIESMQTNPNELQQLRQELETARHTRAGQFKLIGELRDQIGALMVELEESGESGKDKLIEELKAAKAELLINREKARQAGEKQSRVIDDLRIELHEANRGKLILSQACNIDAKQRVERETAELRERIRNLDANEVKFYNQLLAKDRDIQSLEAERDHWKARYVGLCDLDYDEQRKLKEEIAGLRLALQPRPSLLSRIWEAIWS